ncbi:ATP-binding cassette domain-containing protein [soil metagenome]
MHRSVDSARFSDWSPFLIKVEDISKIYKAGRGKTVVAVSGVTFRCNPGEVYGLLGPNGAGKTTTLRILSTAIPPSSGGAFINGHDILRDPAAVRRSIGFLSSNTGLYLRLSPREVLTYFGRLFNVPAELIRSRTEELCDLFDMGEFMDRPCDKLSTGMRQKVNICRSVIHAPEVMIFDEPTAGLDVIASKSIVEFIRRCRTQGKTVLLSTHIMSEVNKLCDRVGIIHKGRLLLDNTLAEFRSEHGDDIEDAFLAVLEANQ